LSVTDLIGQEILSLPFHSMMAIETLDRVIAALTEFFEREGSASRP
jgi:dTDP-4-amino-4,6-dideoxygalactose transaminase